MTARLTIDIKPVEIDGRHWVRMSVNGMEMDRLGPFPNATEARMTTERLIRHWSARAAGLPQAAPGILDVDALIASRRCLGKR